MRFVSHKPAAPLDRFVDSIWYHEAPELPDAIERILPRGSMSLLINLAEDELRGYQGDDLARCHRMKGVALCGAYSEHFAIDTQEQRSIVGVEFSPGGAYPFFDEPADVLANQHVSLELLWRREASLLRERVLHAPSPEAKLRVVERVLLERLARPLERDRAVDFALRAFSDRTPHGRARAVSDVLGELGISGKRLLKSFAEQVGLTPKRYLRVQRFQQTLDVIAAREYARESSRAVVSWASVALDAGFYDQAHFIHEFRAFAGVTPREYVARRREKNHLRVAE